MYKIILKEIYILDRSESENNVLNFYKTFIYNLWIANITNFISLYSFLLFIHYKKTQRFLILYSDFYFYQKFYNVRIFQDHSFSSINNY